MITHWPKAGPLVEIDPTGDNSWDVKIRADGHKIGEITCSDAPGLIYQGWVRTWDTSYMVVVPLWVDGENLWPHEALPELVEAIYGAWTAYD